MARHVDITNDGRLAIHFRYDADLVAEVRMLPGAVWIRGPRRWYVRPSAAALAWAEEHGFHLTRRARALVAAAPAALWVTLEGLEADPVGGATAVAVLSARVPADPALVAEIETIGGVRDTATWRFAAPVSSARAWQIADLAAEWGADARALRALAALRARAEPIEAAEREARYGAMLAASQVDSAAPRLQALTATLLPYQRAGVAYAAARPGVLIGDEMGLGKTLEALAVLELTDAYPAVVVCPTSLRAHWQREAARWLPGRSVARLDSASEPLVCEATDVYVVSYEMARRRAADLAALDPRALVLDEIHALRDTRTQRTKALVQLAAHVRAHGGRVVGLSGTVIVNRPIELAGPLLAVGALGPHAPFGDARAFAERYADASHGPYGWELSGAAHLDELNDRLRATCYLRRTKAEVLPELPELRRAVTLLSAEDQHAYEAAARRLAAALRERRRLLEAAHGPAWVHRLGAESLRWRRDVEALRVLVGLAKVPTVLDWARDYLDGSDRKLVLFAHHRPVIGALVDGLPGAIRLSGDDDPVRRQALVDRFQTAPDARVLVTSFRTGGLGIELTAASDAVVVELPWAAGELDQAEARLHRLGTRAPVTSHIALAAGTVDEPMWQLLVAKERIVQATVQGTIPARSRVTVLGRLLVHLAGGTDEDVEQTVPDVEPIEGAA